MAKKTAKKATIEKEAPATKLQLGKAAPLFSLPDQNGKMVSLKDFRGSYVVLYFYPRAMTPGCTVQACGLRDNEKQLKQEGIVTIGISGDPVKKLKQFEEKHQLNFTLLSDPEHQVTEAYGCWGLKKFMGREFMGILRQTFLIGKKGELLEIMPKVETKTHHQKVLDFFSSLE